MLSRVIRPRFFLGSYMRLSSRITPPLVSESPKASDATSGIRCASSSTTMSFGKSMPAESSPTPSPADRSENKRLWLSITTSAEEIFLRAFW